MMEDLVVLGILFDYYGELLNDKQKEYFKSYYFDNLSLQEISDNMNVSRNAVSKELKLIEGRNTGFPNASAALMENGSQKLEFKMNEHRDYLSVIIPIHEYFKPENKIEDEYEQKLLNILAKNTMSLTELAHAMGYKGITAKLRKKVNEMIEQRKIYIILGENNKPQISIRR